MPDSCQQKNGRVLMAAGGTGGHVFPALAIAENLRAKGIDVLWVGTAAGIESRVVPEHNFPIHFIRVLGVRGKNWAQRLKAPFLLLAAVLQVWKLMRQTKSSCVLGMGGFVSAAAGIAALFAGVPLLIQEQNAVFGTTNRMLAPLAKTIFVGFPNLLVGNAKVVCSGNPLRQEILNVEQPDSRIALESSVSRIFIVGGSLGANVLNAMLPQVIAQLKEQGFTQAIEVLHQTGKHDFETVSAAYQSQGINAQVQDFIDNMAEAYSQADVVISRAGALAVAELAAVGVASILIPYPYAIDDHQTANAKWLVDAGAAICIAQNELTVDRLAAVLVAQLSDRQALKTTAQHGRAASYRDASEIIASACQEVACA